ncbi:MAG: NAD(+) synthase [Kiritimatiellaeota bacterium]|nr:NAD(+) synthase [Kiritimatiellota bacterium]
MKRMSSPGAGVELVCKHLRLLPANCARHVDTLRLVIREWMSQNNVRHVVIGLSGGIDSAVSAALYASVLPRDALTLVNLPGPFTSQKTRGLAQHLADNLRVPLHTLDITRGVNATRDELIAAGFEITPPVFENIQARQRGHLLAAIAASRGGVFSCNANKTEATVGYGTLYGDIAGWLAPLGDLWKGEVYALGRDLNAENPVIPEDIFTVKPSAELSAAQDVTQNKGDPFDYPYHDALFRAWVERGETPKTCLAAWQAGDLATRLGFHGSVPFASEDAFAADMRRWWNLYRGMGAVKRLQAPPVVVLSAWPL